jgi:hypothetical protein
MASALIKVEFYGDQLWGYRNNEGLGVVALRPIVEGMGLNWPSQYQRIQRDPILKEGVVMMTTPSGGGEQQTVCLPLQMLPGWLMGIEANRVNESIRGKVIRYQWECYDVLAKHFLGTNHELIAPLEKMLDDKLGPVHRRLTVIEGGLSELRSDAKALVENSNKGRRDASPETVRIHFTIVRHHYFYKCPCGECETVIANENGFIDKLWHHHHQNHSWDSRPTAMIPLAIRCHQRIENDAEARIRFGEKAFPMFQRLLARMPMSQTSLLLEPPSP